MESGLHVPGPPGGLRGRTSECALLDDFVSAIRRGESRSVVLRAGGWRLEEPEPGVPFWRTPSGRTYVTGPTKYH
jgi:hypothetical protein